MPSALTQLGSMLMSFVDMAMLGRVGTAELDAAALGSIWIWGTLILGIGLVLGIDPIVSQAAGAGDGKRIGLALQRGIVVAFLVSVPIALCWANTQVVLEALGQDHELSVLADAYVRTQIPTLPFFLSYFALRQYLQGRGLVAPALWVMLVANVANAALDYALIFGVDDVGIPALGLVGAGVATAATRALLLAGLAAWVWRFRLYEGAWLPWSRDSFSFDGLLAIVMLGAPIAVQYGLEVWAFQIAGIVVGWMGPDELAAHSIVLNLASLSFTLAFGLSIGTSTRVGNLIGAGEPEAAQRAGWIGIVVGASVMGMCGVLFIVASESLARLYTSDVIVIGLAAGLLPVAAAFQVFDGIQAVAGGVVRACGDSRPAAYANAIGYYVIALPTAGYLVWRGELGLAGVWWSLAGGLLMVSVVLVIWIARRGPRRSQALVQSEVQTPV